MTNNIKNPDYVTTEQGRYDSCLGASVLGKGCRAKEEFMKPGQQWAMTTSLQFGIRQHGGFCRGRQESVTREALAARETSSVQTLNCPRFGHLFPNEPLW